MFYGFLYFSDFTNWMCSLCYFVLKCFVYISAKCYSHWQIHRLFILAKKSLWAVSPSCQRVFSCAGASSGRCNFCAFYVTTCLSEISTLPCELIFLKSDDKFKSNQNLKNLLNQLIDNVVSCSECMMYHITMCTVVYLLAYYFNYFKILTTFCFPNLTPGLHNYYYFWLLFHWRIFPEITPG